MTARVIRTPYGRAALDALRAVVAAAKPDDPMTPVTVLLPNNLAGVVARRHLAHGLTDARPAVAGLHLATLPRLAEQLAAAGLAPRRPATRPVVASAWRAALDEEPGVFAAVKDHPATIRALATAHHELRDLTEPALDVVACSGKLGADVVRLHRGVVGSLRDRWYDLTDLLLAATGVLGADRARAAELGGVVLHLPQNLTQAEAGFARALAVDADLTVVAGMTGVRRADAAVELSLNRLGVTAPDTRPEPRVATRVLHASDADDEARCVVREVVACLQTTPAHRIALLYGSATPYARLLHEQLAAAGIAFNGPGTRSVHERALARGLVGVLGLVVDDVARADLFRALAEAPVRTFDGQRVPVSRWERVSRLAGVVRGDDWSSRLQAQVEREQDSIRAELAGDDPSQSRIEARSRQIASAVGLRDFAGTLRARLGEGLALSTWAGLSTWALDLFHDLYGDPGALNHLPVEEQYAAVAIEGSLRGLAALGEFEATASLQRLREVLEIELESALPRVGRFGEGVLVAPVSASIGLDVDVLFVLGLAEDAYPGRVRQDALLPERVRDLAGTGLAAAREQLDAKHRHLLAAFGAAPTVVASFPRGDLRRSTQRLPSRWLLPTLRQFAGDTSLAATAWDSVDSPRVVGAASYSAELHRTTQLATEQEWRVRATSAGRQLGDVTVDEARDMIGSRAGTSFTRFDGNLAGVADLPNFATGERAVSPTSLESYAVCPHAYFMKRMLRVEPLEDPEDIVSISPLELGNLIHHSMDRLVHDFTDRLPSYGQAWTPEQRGRLLDIATGHAKEFEARGVTGHPLLWERELARVLLDLESMLDDDDAWRRERDARVVASELPFGRDGAPAVVIVVPGGHLQMAGSADKVDQTRDGTLIVTDIKTGSAREFTAIKDDPVVAGTKLQLPVYAYAARQLLGGDKTESQYWFVRKDRGQRIPVVLDDALERTYTQTLATIVSAIARGHFPPKAPDGPDFLYVKCWYCNPDGLGHADVRDQWERKRHDPLLADLVALIDPQPPGDDGEEPS